MQQINGTTATRAIPQESSTGPAAQAITGEVKCGDAPGPAPASATLTIHVTHNQVIVTAQLDMGRPKTAQQVWKRRRGPGKGWVMTKGKQFGHLEWLSIELGELAERLPFPFEVANMLPGQRASRDSVDQAAQEVGHG